MKDIGFIYEIAKKAALKELPKETALNLIKERISALERAKKQ